MSRYQILIDRGNGLEDDGCWGGEHAHFATSAEAIDATQQLAASYPDCRWVVIDHGEDDVVVYRVEPTIDEDAEEVRA